MDIDRQIELLVDLRFRPPHLQRAIRALARLDESIGSHALLERVRVAALKVGGSDPDAVDAAVALGLTDWRDLLVQAEFAEDPIEHERWCAETLLDRANTEWLAGKEIEGVAFELNEPVGVGDALGCVISLSSLTPEWTYTVELSEGREREVPQSRLRRVR